MNLKDKLDRMLPDSGRGAAERKKQETISDLRRRLERVLERDRAGERAAPVVRGEPELVSRDIDYYVPGEIRDTPYGNAFVARSSYAREHAHGGMPLESILEADLSVLELVTDDQALPRLDPRRALFLDTETTGLSGGTGSYAFLVGVGFFEGDGFVVEQYFMRDYTEEAAALHLFCERALDFEALVTFNGKAFDVQLLDTRLILSRMDLRLGPLPNLDLLTPSRRLWKEHLENCRLGTIEERMLGLVRNEDIPGDQIPQAYFDYVRDRDARLIAKVFRHNELDVLSMVTLVAHLAGILSAGPQCEGLSGAELLCLGRVFESRRQLKQAGDCFSRAVDRTEDRVLRRRLLRSLSMVHKREERIEPAVAIWRGLIKEEGPFDLLPYEELAKHYEHRQKDFEQALFLVREALDRIEPDRAAEVEALRHRLNRLVRRAGRAAAASPGTPEGGESG